MQIISKDRPWYPIFESINRSAGEREYRHYAYIQDGVIHITDGIRMLSADCDDIFTSDGTYKLGVTEHGYVFEPADCLGYPDINKIVELMGDVEIFDNPYYRSDSGNDHAAMLLTHIIRSMNSNTTINPNFINDEIAAMVVGVGGYLREHHPIIFNLDCNARYIVMPIAYYTVTWRFYDNNTEINVVECE